jgi:hypothetical protein
MIDSAIGFGPAKFQTFTVPSSEQEASRVSDSGDHASIKIGALCAGIVVLQCKPAWGADLIGATSLVQIIIVQILVWRQVAFRHPGTRRAHAFNRID